METMKNTVRGLSVADLSEAFEYDGELGEIYSKRTGRVIGSFTNGGLYVSKRLGDTVLSLRATIVAWTLYHKEVPDGDVVCKDENPLNIRIHNLIVVPKGTKRHTKALPGSVFVATKYEGIKYHPVKGWYVVDRGKSSPNYFANSLEEAILVQKEWKNNPKRVRFDSFHKNMPYYEEFSLK